MKHPLHPLIVHFPIACWSLSTICDLAGLVLTTNLAQAVGMLMLIGCISAIIAMALGLYDARKIYNNARTAHIADKHMYAAATAWCFYSLSLYSRWDGHVFNNPNISAIITSVIGLVILFVTGWYGATLVYQYGVGVNEKTD